MWISIGKSRKETKWQNRQISWPELTERLKKPKRTPETTAQYHKLTLDQKAEIKDIGGYVGGSIRGGNRIKENIECRTLLALEADEECKDMWQNFLLSYECAALVHSTHSSTKDNLRLRLIIPLSRECFTDEYEAIIRRVADTIGIEFFDPTALQPERLMYWPSIPKDAEYFCKEQEGEFLNVDEVLNTYFDWRDVSQWPLHPKEKKKIKSDIDKQENPLTKEGIIGAFCRTYDIHEAIRKFLPDIYEPTDIEDRYTFKAGSTAAGLVVYDNIFAYSHHSTDTAGGILCNAFDLVRISLYSDLDEGINDSVAASKRPSFIKCCETLIKDTKVKKLLITEKLKEAKGDFTEVESSEINLDEDDNTKEDWYNKLETDKKGNVIYSTTNNIVLIMQNDKRLKNVFRWDNFNHRIILAIDTYWKKIEKPSDTWLDDNDKANIRHYLEKMYGISGKDKINDALLIVAHKNKFHPVINYLNGLVWDGTERLDTLLVDYMGAEDNDYTRAVTRKTFVGAIARIFEPGCKFDTMLILVGMQGMGKSTLLHKLGGAWFSDNVGSLHTKESMEQLRGVWIMEMAELAGLKRADVEIIKAFIARTEDRFRQAFGETVSNFPRQSIFIGTTNETEFLIDTTGNRRFWPVVCKNKKGNKDTFKITEAQVKQIWAEAIYHYQNCEPLYLDKRINAIAQEVQDEHTEQESWQPLIEEYLNTPVPANWNELTPSERYDFMHDVRNDFGKKEAIDLEPRYKVTPLEIWLEALNGRKENFKKMELKAVKNAMKKIEGWEYKMLKIDKINVRGWMKELKAVTK